MQTGKLIPFLVTTMIVLSSVLVGAETLEVRFCPTGRTWSYPAESQRGVQSLLLQNVIVINRGSNGIDINAVDIELMHGSMVVDTRHIAGDDLKRLAGTGPRLQSAGFLRLVSFQFCGDQLIPRGTVLSGPALKPGEAMLVMAEPFTYPGTRDTLRLRVTATSGSATVNGEGSEPIQNGMAPVKFHFPLSGTWYAGNGPTFYTAHRWALPEEFGFDLVQLGDNTSSYRGDGTKFTDYYAYGQPVLASADGRVKAVVDNIPESPEALRRPAESIDAYMQRVQQMQAEHLEKGTAAGNYVLLENGDGVYSLYAHLRPASIKVKAGDAVKAGQAIGLLGSSGNSTEPHLHFQVCDRPDPLSCAGIPVDFVDIELPYADGPRPLQSGDIVQSRK
jgi:murein DD-endopeptidase MepM/ murein hydrolase activator NlpD